MNCMPGTTQHPFSKTWNLKCTQAFFEMSQSHYCCYALWKAFAVDDTGFIDRLKFFCPHWKPHHEYTGHRCTVWDSFVCLCMALSACMFYLLCKISWPFHAPGTVGQKHGTLWNFNAFLGLILRNCPIGIGTPVYGLKPIPCTECSTCKQGVKELF